MLSEADKVYIEKLEKAMDAKTRRVIGVQQISVTCDTDSVETIYALRTDGVIFKLNDHKNIWTRLPPVPDFEE